MKISDIIRETVERLRKCEALTGVPVIQRDLGSVRNRIDTEIAKRKCCVVVYWSGFTPVIQGKTAPGGKPFGTVGIVARVFEKPSMNRTSSGALTVYDMAIAIADALNGAIAKGMAVPIWLKSIGDVLEDSEDASVVTCDVNFETKASLN